MSQQLDGRFHRNVVRGNSMPEPRRRKYLEGIIRGLLKGLRRIGSDPFWKTRITNGITKVKELLGK